MATGATAPALTGRQRAAMAARLRRGRNTAAGNGPAAVALNDGPPRHPLVLFHALGGTVFPYGHLARALADERRVFGVPVPPDLPLDVDLDGLVARHLSTLRGVVGDGPCLLGGWSMGGVLAFEVARLLDPRQVRSVALLDSPFWLPACPDIGAEGFAGQFVSDAARSLGPEVGAPPDPERTGVEEQLHWLARHLDPADPAAMAPELHRRLAVFRSCTEALAGYHPSGPLLADALVVDVEESPNSSLRWCEVLRGDVRATSLPGTHYSFLMPPLVSTLVDLLRDPRPDDPEGTP